MVTQETLDALNKRREELLKEAEIIETERKSLDPKKDAQRIEALEKTAAQFQEKADELNKQRDEAKAEIEKRAAYKKTLEELKEKKDIAIHKDTAPKSSGNKKFSLDRVVAIAIGQEKQDGVEGDYISDPSLITMNRDGSFRLSGGLTKRMVQETRDSAFSLAGQESQFHSMKVTTPIGLAARLGADVQFGDQIGVASALDFFAGAGTAAGTSNTNLISKLHVSA